MTTSVQNGQNNLRFYEERASTLTHTLYHALISVIVLAQIIYLNLHYIIGIILISVSLCFIVAQVIIGALEMHYVDTSDHTQLKRTYRLHQWLLHVYFLVLIPLLIWTVVVMSEKQAV